MKYISFPFMFIMVGWCHARYGTCNSGGKSFQELLGGLRIAAWIVMVKMEERTALIAIV